MNLTDQHRDDIYEKATVAQKYLYSHPDSGLKLFTISRKNDLHHEDSYKKFAITVGDIILGFYKIEDTVPLLRQELGIDDATAERLGADVLQFLAPLSDPNWQPPEEVGEDDHENAITDDRGVPPPHRTTPTAAAEPVAVPEEVAFVPIKSSLDTTPLHPPTDRTNTPTSQPQVVRQVNDSTHSTFSAMIPANEPVPPPTTPNMSAAIPIISAPPRPTPPPTPSAPLTSVVNTQPSAAPSPFDTPRPVPPPPAGSRSHPIDEEPVYRSTQPTRADLSAVPNYQTAPTDTAATPPNPPRWSTS